MKFDISQFRRMPAHATEVITRRIMRAHHWRRRCDAYLTASKTLPSHHPQHFRALALADAAEARAQAFDALLAGDAERAIAFRAVAAMQGARAKAMVAL